MLVGEKQEEIKSYNQPVQLKSSKPVWGIYEIKHHS